MGEQFLILEKKRILIAEELDIPPDDVDISTIYEVAFRAIRESFAKDNGEILIHIKNKREEEVILSDIGKDIIHRIFSDIHPFEGVVKDYEDWYTKYVVHKINEGEF